MRVAGAPGELAGWEIEGRRAGRGWGVSAAIHLGIVLGAFAIARGFPTRGEVEIAVIEAPLPAPAGVKPVALERPKPAPPKLKAKGVFGVSPHSAPVATSAADVGVKAGNTVAKAPDQEMLRAGDAENLPVPTDEYLITQMPKLVSDVRVPYPPIAKKDGVQGAVVMELLIDGTGQVREARLVEGPGHGLDEAALAAARGFRFAPAQVQGKAVAVRIRYAYRFVLER